MIPVNLWGRTPLIAGGFTVPTGCARSWPLFIMRHTRLLRTYPFYELQDDLMYGIGRFQELKRSSGSSAIAYRFIACLPETLATESTTFLAKGETRTVLQNTPDVLTSFEWLLIRCATDTAAVDTIAVVPGLHSGGANEDSFVGQPRRVCEKMERYVNIFRDGDMGRLIYQNGLRGRSGRGPVNQLLVDLLLVVKKRAAASGVQLDIAPCHKFLAKDIMSWNDAWGDDVFANGKIGMERHSGRARSDILQYVTEV
ncbi:uncharacterized protein EV422DRAFT_577033 [Fimicolochytrium jonesii]|uniref:uncharacterized protein n=1 Tax=Fimicolochytrium jonesii TaxID=1396493 RepID=UPI0022FEE505|nr:uncharacterized protein EV422DRAFT_577033 [Fimicolochytrium jonesii]KAI8823492.1 hypothetical protein EV422DRAFT_577033 [Fimicolochytrium jonesii]